MPSALVAPAPLDPSSRIPLASRIPEPSRLPLRKMKSEKALKAAKQVPTKIPEMPVVKQGSSGDLKSPTSSSSLAQGKLKPLPPPPLDPSASPKKPKTKTPKPSPISILRRVTSVSNLLTTHLPPKTPISPIMSKESPVPTILSPTSTIDLHSGLMPPLPSAASSEWSSADSTYPLVPPLTPTSPSSGNPMREWRMQRSKRSPAPPPPTFDDSKVKAARQPQPRLNKRQSSIEGLRADLDAYRRDMSRQSSPRGSFISGTSPWKPTRPSPKTQGRLSSSTSLVSLQEDNPTELGQMTSPSSAHTSRTLNATPVQPAYKRHPLVSPVNLFLDSLKADQSSRSSRDSSRLDLRAVLEKAAGILSPPSEGSTSAHRPRILPKRDSFESLTATLYSTAGTPTTREASIGSLSALSTACSTRGPRTEEETQALHVHVVDQHEPDDEIIGRESDQNPARNVNISRTKSEPGHVRTHTRAESLFSLLDQVPLQPPRDVPATAVKSSLPRSSGLLSRFPVPPTRQTSKPEITTPEAQLEVEVSPGSAFLTPKVGSKEVSAPSDLPYLSPPKGGEHESDMEVMVSQPNEDSDIDVSGTLLNAALKNRIISRRSRLTSPSSSRTPSGVTTPKSHPSRTSSPSKPQVSQTIGFVSSANRSSGSTLRPDRFSGLSGIGRIAQSQVGLFRTPSSTSRRSSCQSTGSGSRMSSGSLPSVTRSDSYRVNRRTSNLSTMERYSLEGWSGSESEEEEFVKAIKRVSLYKMPTPKLRRPPSFCPSPRSTSSSRSGSPVKAARSASDSKPLPRTPSQSKLRSTEVDSKSPMSETLASPVKASWLTVHSPQTPRLQVPYNSAMSRTGSEVSLSGASSTTLESQLLTPSCNEVCSARSSMHSTPSPEVGVSNGAQDVFESTPAADTSVDGDTKRSSFKLLPKPTRKVAGWGQPEILMDEQWSGLEDFEGFGRDTSEEE